MSVETIQIGIGNALQEIPGVQVTEGAYALSNPTPPHLFAYLHRLEFDRTLQRGYDTYTWRVVALVSLGAFDIGSQLNLSRYMNPTGAYSIKQVMEADQTLGGSCQTVRVRDIDAWGPYRREGGGDLLGAQWTVEITARGDA
jgi:hypothetical protein